MKVEESINERWYWKEIIKKYPEMSHFIEFAAVHKNMFFKFIRKRRGEE